MACGFNFEMLSNKLRRLGIPVVKRCLASKCTWTFEGTQGLLLCRSIVCIVSRVQMVRKLKFHEQKLLKKVDFFQWKATDNVREIKIMRKYLLQNRDDYTKYNKICGLITSLANKLSLLKPEDPFRASISEQLLRKLFAMGIVTSDANLSSCAKVTASAFCRRRLPVIMTQSKMSENLKEAVTFIEQGQVRVGPEIVTDPAFLVVRSMEDFVTWVDTSKIKRKIMEYNDTLDDYDLDV